MVIRLAEKSTSKSLGCGLGVLLPHFCPHSIYHRAQPGGDSRKFRRPDAPMWSINISMILSRRPEAEQRRHSRLSCQTAKSDLPHGLPIPGNLPIAAYDYFRRPCVCGKCRRLSTQLPNCPAGYVAGRNQGYFAGSGRLYVVWRPKFGFTLRCLFLPNN